jgi:tetratricopeptide (TPR) repeat protein
MTLARDSDDLSEIDRISRQVLDHFNVEGEESLVELPQNRKDALAGKLETFAWAALNRLDLAPEERSEASANIISLIEVSLEANGLLPAAVALYALVHDARTGREDSATQFERAVLRFKLGHVLWMLDEHNPENIARCAEFARRTLRHAEKLWSAPGISSNSFYSLIFKLQSWLGDRYEEVGDYERASQAFSEATIVARTPADRITSTTCFAGCLRQLGQTQKAGEILLLAETDLDQIENPTDRVASITRFASCLEQLGQGQKAFEILLLADADLDKVEDPEIWELWAALEHSLRFQLGGSFFTEVRRERPPLSPWLAEMSVASITMEKETPLDSISRDQSRLLLGQALEEISSAEPQVRHGYLLAMALQLVADGDPAKAERLMDEAKALESLFDSGSARLDRSILEARAQLHQGDPTGAWKWFEALLPEVEKLAGRRRQLETTGYALESLLGMAAQGQLRPNDTSALAGRVGELLAAALLEQPGAPARRRLREIHQRTIEAAVAALLATADGLGIHDAAGQRFLARAWNLVLVTRNPDLQMVSIDQDRCRARTNACVPSKMLSTARFGRTAFCGKVRIAPADCKSFSTSS